MQNAFKTHLCACTPMQLFKVIHSFLVDPHKIRNRRNGRGENDCEGKASGKGVVRSGPIFKKLAALMCRCVGNLTSKK